MAKDEGQGSSSNETATTRRTFLAATAGALSTTGLAPALARAPARKGPIADGEIRVALVGCGGRGTGAARQALSTDGKVRLVAMAAPSATTSTRVWSD